jgi:hypothetical protein
MIKFLESKWQLIPLYAAIIISQSVGLTAQNQIKTKVTIIKETVDENGTKTTITIEKEGPEAEKIDIEALSEGEIDIDLDRSDNIVIEKNIETEIEKDIQVRKRFRQDHPFHRRHSFRSDRPYKPKLGIMIRDHEEGGAIISEVLEGSPADHAGLKAGDIIKIVDEFEVDDAEDLVEYISEEDEDGILDLTLIRNGEEIKIEANLLKNEKNDP